MIKDKDDIHSFGPFEFWCDRVNTATETATREESSALSEEHAKRRMDFRNFCSNGLWEYRYGGPIRRKEIARSSADAMIPSGAQLESLQEDLARRMHADSEKKKVPWEGLWNKERDEFRQRAASALNFMRERIQAEMNANNIDLLVAKRMTPCGGCGNADPAKRCLGCLHSFYDGDPMGQYLSVRK